MRNEHTVMVLWNDHYRRWAAVDSDTLDTLEVYSILLSTDDAPRGCDTNLNPYSALCRSVLPPYDHKRPSSEQLDERKLNIAVITSNRSTDDISAMLDNNFRSTVQWIIDNADAVYV